MQYLAMQSNDIRTNLATEQYLMNSDKIEPPFMLFYIEKPCVIVGRNQNTLEEVNASYCRHNDITVTRRLSGGGAMYQDLGNLCFSFVVPAEQQRFGDFKTLVQPLVNALHAMGAHGAEINGRNDLTINGKKFSGNAMYTRKGKTFSHGTLMFDVDIAAVENALNVPQDKIESKGIKSVHSRVVNLKNYLDPKYQAMDTFGFRDELIKKIWQVDSIEEAKKFEYQLTPEDQMAIQKIKKERYSNWDWVYGQSPQFTVKKRKHFTGGTIDARFNVKDGYIDNVKFYGDFFGVSDVSAIEMALKGVKYEPNAIEKVLKSFDLNQYFYNIDQAAIIDLLAN